MFRILQTREMTLKEENHMEGKGNEKDEKEINIFGFVLGKGLLWKNKKTV